MASGLDFMEVLEETSGMDFKDFFDQWYFGYGYPVYLVSWQQQGGMLDMQSVQTGSSELTPLFKMSMEYKIYYPGGDSTVRVFHQNGEENYQFEFKHPVDSIQVDPDNQVLNKVVDSGEGSAKKESGAHILISPNPNPGHFTFELPDEWEGDISLVVYNASGQVVLESRFEGCLPHLEYGVDLKETGNGLYIIRFSYGKMVTVEKIIVE